MPGELCGAGWAGCHGGDSGCQWWELVTECRQPECPVLAPLVAPAGFRVAAQTEALAGTALVGQAVLYLWPDYGWVRGTVARRRTAAAGPLASESRTWCSHGTARLPPSHHALAWLPFSWTTVMVRPAAGLGRIGEWTGLDPSACFGVSLFRHEIVGCKGHGLVRERVLHLR